MTAVILRRLMLMHRVGRRMTMEESSNLGMQSQFEVEPDLGKVVVEKERRCTEAGP